MAKMYNNRWLLWPNAALVVGCVAMLQCTPKLFDNTDHNANQSKQAVDGDGNTTTSQGARSTNQSVGDITGAGVLVL